MTADSASLKRGRILGRGTHLAPSAQSDGSLPGAAAWPLAATLVPESEAATSASAMVADKPTISHLQSGLSLMFFFPGKARGKYQRLGEKTLNSNSPYKPQGL